MTAPKFILTTCQIGAEAALKDEIARLWPEFNLSFSRPGFITFKLPDGFKINRELDLKSVFARSFGICLAKVQCDDSAANLNSTAEEIWQLVEELDVKVVHVWQRESVRSEKVEDSNGDESIQTGKASVPASVSQLIKCLQENFPEKYRDLKHPPLFQKGTKAGQLVLDCVLVDPGTWWIGYHWTNNTTSRYPDGVLDIKFPENMISRAYLKMQEALLWSRLPVQRGDSCIELGCAPGGASQALLDRGLKVIGVDPAKVDPLLLDHPDFRYINKRGMEVRKRVFQEIPWLMADMSLVPNSTLDTIEDIVKNENVHLQGMLITLKFLDWKYAAEVPNYLDRIRSWGFRHVTARQLLHHRQEICVSVLKNRSLRRILGKKPRRTKKTER